MQEDTHCMTSDHVPFVYNIACKIPGYWTTAHPKFLSEGDSSSSYHVLHQCCNPQYIVEDKYNEWRWGLSSFTDLR